MVALLIGIFSFSSMRLPAIKLVMSRVRFVSKIRLKIKLVLTLLTRLGLYFGLCSFVSLQVGPSHQLWALTNFKSLFI